MSPTAEAHLLYTRFKSVSKKVAPLLGELERRAQAYPDELSALLSECHSYYFSTRKGLLMPRIIEEIKGLDPSRSELVELASCFIGLDFKVVLNSSMLDAHWMQLHETSLHRRV